MSPVQLRQVRWLDPFGDRDDTVDLRVDDQGLRAIETPDPALPTIDAQGLWLLPGPIDLGFELPADSSPDRQAMAGELQAALRCGLAQVVASPDTRPILDAATSAHWVRHHASVSDGARLHLLGALTQALEGRQLANMAALKAAGCVGLAQGRSPLPELGVLRQALRYATDLDMTVHLAPRAPDLNRGCAHDGVVATALGLEGIPVAAETVGMAVLLALAEDTGCRLHFARLSSGAAASLLVQARQRGLAVSADVAIWNLLFDHSAVQGYDSRFHLHAPLREESDRQTLLGLIRDGLIEAVCSDHRPLGRDAKFGPFAETQPGTNGMDGYLSLLLRLVAQGDLSPLQLAKVTSAGPAGVLRQAPETACARWLLVDPQHRWELNDGTRHSQGNHSPLQGETLLGAAAGWLGPEGLHLFPDWRARHGV